MSKSCGACTEHELMPKEANFYLCHWHHASMSMTLLNEPCNCEGFRRGREKGLGKTLFQKRRIYHNRQTKPKPSRKPKPRRKQK